MNIRTGQILGLVFTMVSVDAACAGVVRPSTSGALVSTREDRATEVSLSSPAESSAVFQSTSPNEPSSLVSLWTRDGDHIGVARLGYAPSASIVIAEDTNLGSVAWSRRSLTAIGSAFRTFNDQQRSGAATDEYLFPTESRGLFAGERPFENLLQNGVTKLTVAGSDWTLYGNYSMAGQATGSTTLPSFGSEPGGFSSVPLPPAAYPAFALAGVFAVRALWPRRQ